MSTIRATFENGVFRPEGKVELAEHTKVEFEPRPIVSVEAVDSDPMEGVYRVLSQNYDSGHTDTAERHFAAAGFDVLV